MALTDDTVSIAPKERQKHIEQFKPSVLLQKTCLLVAR